MTKATWNDGTRPLVPREVIDAIVRKKPPFPGKATKPSVIPRLIGILKKYGLPYKHLEINDPD